MATFILKIDCDNAAFSNSKQDCDFELGRILREIAEKIESGQDYSHFRTVQDYNGNEVGRYALKGWRGVV